MLTALRSRTDRESDEGFTLIELMVVVLIIGILLAIAIPTFLGARNRANDRSTQSNLRNALTAEKTLYTDSQTYTTSDLTSTPTGKSVLTAVEPSLDWEPAGVLTINRQVSATASVPSGGVNATTLVLQAQSATGTCFFMVDISAPGTPSGTFYSSDKTSKCSATLPAPPTAAVSRTTSDGTPTDWANAF